MKATISFDFDLPEEETEMRTYSSAPEMQRFIWEFQEQLRSWAKYGHPFKDTDDAVHGIREMWYQIKDNYRIED